MPFPDLPLPCPPPVPPPPPSPSQTEVPQFVAIFMPTTSKRFRALGLAVLMLQPNVSNAFKLWGTQVTAFPPLPSHRLGPPLLPEPFSAAFPTEFHRPFSNAFKLWGTQVSVRKSCDLLHRLFTAFPLHIHCRPTAFPWPSPLPSKHLSTALFSTFSTVFT